MMHDEENKILVEAKAQAQRLKKRSKTLKELLPISDKPISWIIDDLISSKSMTIIGGAPASFKSTLAQHLALCVAGGYDFLGAYQTKKSVVVYIDSENSDYLSSRRFKQLLCGHQQEPPENLIVIPINNLYLNEAGSEIALNMLINDTGAKLIVLDSMRRFNNGQEDSADDTSRVFDQLKWVMDDTEVAFVAIHHLRKTKSSKPDMNDLRGSGDFAAMTDFTFLVSKQEKTGNITFRTSKHRYKPESEFPPITIGVRNPFGTDESILFEHMGIVEEYKTVGEECCDLLADWITDNGIEEFRAKQAITYLKSKGFNDNGWRGAVTEAKKRWLFVAIKKGVYKVCTNKIQEGVNL